MSERSERLEFLFSIHPNAKKRGGRIPDRKHSADSGYDVYPVDLSDLSDKYPNFPYTLKPGEVIRIPTGLTFQAPVGWSPDVVAKTSRAWEGIEPAAIVYDWGYRPNPNDPAGSVFSVRNVSNVPVVIDGKKSFVQLILRPVCPADVVVVNHGTIEAGTERGQKRYGAADNDNDNKDLIA